MNGSAALDYDFLLDSSHDDSLNTDSDTRWLVEGLTIKTMKQLGEYEGAISDRQIGIDIQNGVPALFSEKVGESRKSPRMVYVGIPNSLAFFPKNYSKQKRTPGLDALRDEIVFGNVQSFCDQPFQVFTPALLFSRQETISSHKLLNRILEANPDLLLYNYRGSSAFCIPLDRSYLFVSQTVNNFFEAQARFAADIVAHHYTLFRGFADQIRHATGREEVSVDTLEALALDARAYRRFVARKPKKRSVSSRRKQSKIGSSRIDSKDIPKIIEHLSQKYGYDITRKGSASH